MSNISGWTEGVLLTLAFIAVLGIVIGSFNILYGGNYGLGITDNTTALFIQYQDTADQQIGGGDVEFDAQQGITLKSSYGLAKDAISIIWSFLSGGFIQHVALMWNVGDSGLLLAKSIQIIWVLSLVFALLYALFKVVL